VLDFLMAPENLPFAVALVLMLMIGAVEAVGLGVGAAGVDAGPDLDGDADLLGWLGVGRIPLLMLIVLLLALFGMIGIAGQQIAAAVLGAPLSPWIAGPAAFVASLPFTGLAARGLARIMPQDETTAVSLEELVGLRATVVVGTARQGSPARASVRDRHGLTHYVMAEPTDAQSVGEGGTLLLVRREGDIFVGLPEGRDLFASAAAPGPPALMK
jgi:membrane protein implicated in regulation of membrane protease activity